MGRRTRKVQHEGNTLRSGFEQRVAKHLESKEVPYTYEQDNIAYVIPATTRKYVPDFKLENGIFIEAKGKWDAEGRRKMALVVEQNPDKDVRMLFMRDNPIRKGSKTHYTDWAAKIGIKCAVSAEGVVPEEWLHNAKPKKKRERKPRS